MILLKLTIASVLVCASSGYDHGGDGPLFLTPYIESRQLDKAKKLSRVQPLKGNMTSHSGLLTVDRECGSNMFFWFFPAVENPETAPVLLWLQGGPGASSLFGLFTEHGPYVLTPEGYLKTRQYSWSRSFSMLYIDNPVGTGYSFTGGVSCYSTNQTHVGLNLYNALTQFFTLFSEYQQQPFFVTGESYAGKYVPAVSYTIHKNNPNSAIKINLQGLAIGNGLVDPESQVQYGDYLYQLGLVDSNTLEIFHYYEELGRQYIANKSWDKAFECFDKLLNGDQLNGTTILTNATGFTYYFNYMYNDGKPEGDVDTFVQKQSIRKQIHVGNTTWGDSILVEKQLMEDVMQSVKPWLEELLEHYRILIYNGQLDIIVAYPMTVNYLKKLKWSAAEEYKTAPRHLWKVGSELAGYAKSAGNLTEVMVRNAGHLVPADQPKWGLDLITRFVNNKKFHD